MQRDRSANLNRPREPYSECTYKEARPLVRFAPIQICQREFADQFYLPYPKFAFYGTGSEPPR